MRRSDGSRTLPVDSSGGKKDCSKRRRSEGSSESTWKVQQRYANLTYSISHSRQSRLGRIARVCFAEPISGRCGCTCRTDLKRQAAEDLERKLRSQEDRRSGRCPAPPRVPTEPVVGLRMRVRWRACLC
jgi:hypothetical protein